MLQYVIAQIIPSLLQRPKTTHCSRGKCQFSDYQIQKLSHPSLNHTMGVNIKQALRVFEVVY